jgi:3-hydroxyisobutyrate dehydrogenase-like beta-hydroxyacid dehydrogenase
VAVVGFVGLGNIGKPMALRLAAADGIDLVAYDISPEPLAELAAAGARTAPSVADLAREAEVICVMVRDDEQVREVLASIVGVAADGTVVVVHSTVGPHTPEHLAETAHRHGLRLVDAPVSGGAMGAADGTLAILVGGSEDAVAAARPVLEVMGSHVVHAGPIGAGTAMKIARNLMHFVAFTAATEAQRLAEAAGLDLIALGDVVRHTDSITGGPGAIMHRATTAPLEPDDFWHGVFGHVVALGEKDLGFAVGLADELDVDVPLARLALERLAPGLGFDTPSVVEVRGAPATSRETTSEEHTP